MTIHVTVAIAISFFCGAAFGVFVAKVPRVSAATVQAVTVTPGDTAAAKEQCRRHHLAWSRLEVAVDSARFTVHCESDDVVREQVLQCAAVRSGR